MKDTPDWIQWRASYDMPMPAPKMKLDLPSVTLFCADCISVERVIPVIERCKALCNFGAVKLLTHLPTDYPHRIEISKLSTHIEYSIFMFKRAYQYIDTKHVLIVQHDGWILNTDAWNQEWLNNDYMGPLFIHKHPIDERSVGSGGFSLRTKRLMQFVSKNTPPWDGSPEEAQRIQKMIGAYEDGVISICVRDSLVNAGFKFATPLEASRFAQGGQNDINYYTSLPFGFHGQWHNIDLRTGQVAPPPFWEEK